MYLEACWEMLFGFAPLEGVFLYKLKIIYAPMQNMLSLTIWGGKVKALLNALTLPTAKFIYELNVI